MCSVFCCLFVCLGFHIHLKYALLILILILILILVKGWRYWTLPGTSGHMAVMVFKGICLKWIMVPWPQPQEVKLSLLFYDLGLSRLGFKHPTYRKWGERSSRLRRLPPYQKPMQNLSDRTYQILRDDSWIRSWFPNKNVLKYYT